jgi:protein translocase SecG subunit
MSAFLTVFQIIISLLVITLVFLQSSGESESRSNILSSVTFQKRGWEKVMFYITVIAVILFLISSIIQTLL